MANDHPATNARTYRTREAVGVFDDADALEAAVNELAKSGFDRSSMSVLGTDDKVKERIGHLYRKVTEIEDDRRAPRAAFVSKEAEVEAATRTIVVPFYIGGIAGAVAVVASGGALAAAVAAAILGSATGTVLGGLLEQAVAAHHARQVEEEVARGGLVLWVGAADAEAEKRAVAVLKKAGGRHIHVHEIQREIAPEGSATGDSPVEPIPGL